MNRPRCSCLVHRQFSTLHLSEADRSNASAGRPLAPEQPVLSKRRDRYSIALVPTKVKEHLPALGILTFSYQKGDVPTRSFLLPSPIHSNRTQRRLHLFAEPKPIS